MNIFLNFFTKIVLAQSRSGGLLPPAETPQTFSLPNPLGVTTIIQLVDRIAGYLILIAAPIVTIMIIYAAFIIMAHGDNPEKVRTGWKIITWAAVGYAIILISKGIALIILEILGGRGGGSAPLISV